MYAKLFCFVFFFGLLTFLYPVSVSAQVVINEFSSSDTSDWIEIYNLSDSSVNMSGWTIKDTASSNVYDFSNEVLPTTSSCFITVSNRLNNGGDRIQLLKDSVQIDCVAYGNGNGSFCNIAEDVAAPAVTETASRVPEGTGSWTLGLATKSGTDCVTLVPTPTPSPVPDPTSTASPKPVSTLTPTPTKTPSPTPKPTSTKKPTSSPTPQESEEVLGFRNELISESPTPSAEVLGDAKGKFPLASVFFLLGGGAFISLAGFSFFKQRRVNYTDGDEKGSNDS